MHTFHLSPECKKGKTCTAEWADGVMPGVHVLQAKGKSQRQERMKRGFVVKPRCTFEIGGSSTGTVVQMSDWEQTMSENSLPNQPLWLYMRCQAYRKLYVLMVSATDWRPAWLLMVLPPQGELPRRDPPLDTPSQFRIPSPTSSVPMLEAESLRRNRLISQARWSTQSRRDRSLTNSTCQGWA